MQLATEELGQLSRLQYVQAGKQMFFFEFCGRGQHG